MNVSVNSLNFLSFIMLSERILSSLSLFFEKNNMRELSQAEGGKNHDST